MAGNGADELPRAATPCMSMPSTLLALVDETGASRHGGASRWDRLLVRPFTEGAFLALVEQQLLLAMRKVPASIPDESYPRLPRRPHRARLHAHPSGARRRASCQVLVPGRGRRLRASPINDHHLLERLRGRWGLCERCVAHRLRRCPSCAGQQLVLGEVCLSCEDTDYAPRGRAVGRGRCARARKVALPACGAEAERAPLLARCLDCEQRAVRETRKST